MKKIIPTQTIDWLNILDIDNSETKLLDDMLSKTALSYLGYNADTNLRSISISINENTSEDVLNNTISFINEFIKHTPRTFLNPTYNYSYSYSSKMGKTPLEFIGKSVSFFKIYESSLSYSGIYRLMEHNGKWCVIKQSHTFWFTVETPFSSLLETLITIKEKYPSIIY